MRAPVTGWPEESDKAWEAALGWRSENPRVPSAYRIDPEFNCLTNTENLLALDPSLRYQEGWARLGDGDEWGAHAWAVTPDGEIVDPYAEWHQWLPELKYRPATPCESPFEYP